MIPDNNNPNNGNPYSYNGMSGENRPSGDEKEYRHYRATRRASFHFFTAVIGTLFPTLILPFIFAPLSITYAYLAKGKRKKNDWYNNLLIFFSVILICLNGIFCGYALYSVNHDTALHKKFEEASQQWYGMSFEDYLNEQLNGGVTDTNVQGGSIQNENVQDANTHDNNSQNSIISGGNAQNENAQNVNTTDNTAQGTTIQNDNAQNGGTTNE